jgi:hypothetical protein
MSSRHRHHIHVAAIGSAALISLGYVVAPAYETNGAHQTVIEANGAWVIAVLLVPLALAALPLLVPRRARTSAIRWAAAVLTLFALLTGFTIGTPYLVSAALMWVAGVGPGGAARDNKVGGQA